MTTLEAVVSSAMMDQMERKFGIELNAMGHRMDIWEKTSPLERAKEMNTCYPFSSMMVLPTEAIALPYSLKISNRLV